MSCEEGGVVCGKLVCGGGGVFGKVVCGGGGVWGRWCVGEVVCGCGKENESLRDRASCMLFAFLSKYALVAT